MKWHIWCLECWLDGIDGDAVVCIIIFSSMEKKVTLGLKAPVIQFISMFAGAVTESVRVVLRPPGVREGSPWRQEGGASHRRLPAALPGLTFQSQTRPLGSTGYVGKHYSILCTSILYDKLKSISQVFVVMVYVFCLFFHLFSIEVHTYTHFYNFKNKNKHVCIHIFKQQKVSFWNIIKEWFTVL